MNPVRDSLSLLISFWNNQALIVSDAFCSDTVGSYTFYKNVQYMPYSIAIYAVCDGEVYTLKEAYEKGKVDIQEVYSFMPQRVKSPS